MAKSTYISENLNSEQIAFLKLLDDYEVEYFTLDAIEDELETEVPKLNEIVENLANKQLLDRIERGKYTRPNFKDPNVLGTFIVPGKAAVAYWSALSAHGLTERFPNTVFIKTTTQKRSKQLFGVNYKFVQVKKERFTGIMHRGYGNHQFPMTDLEMTIVDCFDQMRYAGEFPDLIRAFNRAELNDLKLIKYAHLIGNRSAIKRMACIAEITGKKNINKFVQWALKQNMKRYMLLDPTGAEEGEFSKKWNLRMNLSEADILVIVKTPY